MHESLLDILVEPETHAPLKLEARRGTGDVIHEGVLVSTATSRRYDVVRGIPRFVPRQNYSETFGFQWNEFRPVQLDSLNGASYSIERFDNETGWTQQELSGARVLDAGCGAGRFAEVAADRGARLVALDLSSAVEATAQTLQRFNNVDVVQGSLLSPPFRPGTFDFAYCLGVLQHTPNPALGVQQVANACKPGGQFALTIYGRKPWTKLNAKYLIRPVTKRMPAKLLLGAIRLTMPIAFPITDLLFRVPYLGRLAQFTIPVATYVEHREHFTKEQRYEEAVLDTFDMLAPSYDSPMTAAEVSDALASLGVGNVVFRTRYPVNVVGTR